ncbi:MAG: IS1 family transposase [Dongiaceae bacterium]
MNRLPTEKRVQILGMMVKGMSIRSIARLAGVSKNTIAKLLVDAGAACSEYQDRMLRELPCKRLQLDEIWSFVYAKAKNVRTAKAAPEIASDIWTWTAIDADTKLIASWMVGDRSGATAKVFIADLASRLANRVQITTDGRNAYLQVIDDAFGIDVDYAILEKVYAVPAEAQTRYSPPVCVGAKQKEVLGRPDHDRISTSYAERQNLNIRMGNRRFTRLTSAFSKKVENHVHALSIYFMHYNFVRIHQTTHVTPAMAASVTQTLWSLTDIVLVVDKWEKARKRNKFAASPYIGGSHVNQRW